MWKKYRGKENVQFSRILDQKDDFLQHRGHMRRGQCLGPWEHRQSRRKCREKQRKWRWEHSRSQQRSANSTSRLWRWRLWHSTSHPLRRALKEWELIETFRASSPQFQRAIRKAGLVSAVSEKQSYALSLSLHGFTAHLLGLWKIDGRTALCVWAQTELWDSFRKHWRA